MSIWPWLNEACPGEFIWNSRMIGHKKLSHQSLALLLRPLLAVRARPLHCRTPALQLHHCRHCAAPKTPSDCPRGTDHPSLSLYIRSPPSITPICRIINDLVRNNPNTLRPHHRSETNPTASQGSTTLGDSPQQLVLLSK